MRISKQENPLPFPVKTASLWVDVRRRRIEAYYIGNEKGIATKLKLGSSLKVSKEDAALAGREKKVQHELLLLRNAYKEIRRKYPPEVRNQNPIYMVLPARTSHCLHS